MLDGDSGLGPVAVVVVFSVGVVFVFPYFMVSLLSLDVFPVGAPRLEGVAVCVVAVMGILVVLAASTGCYEAAVIVVVIGHGLVGMSRHGFLGQPAFVVIFIKGCVLPHRGTSQHAALGIAGNEEVRHAISFRRVGAQKVSLKTKQTAILVVVEHNAVLTTFSVHTKIVYQPAIAVILIMIVSLIEEVGNRHVRPLPLFVISLRRGDKEPVGRVHAKLRTLHRLHPSPIPHLLHTNPPRHLALSLYRNRQE